MVTVCMQSTTAIKMGCPLARERAHLTPVTCNCGGIQPFSCRCAQERAEEPLKTKVTFLLSLCYFSVLQNAQYVFPELYTLIGNDFFSWPPLVFCIPMKYQFNSFSCLVIVKRLNWAWWHVRTCIFTRLEMVVFFLWVAPMAHLVLLSGVSVFSCQWAHGAVVSCALLASTFSLTVILSSLAEAWCSCWTP